MLYSLDWLAPGQPFPPLCERGRLTRYNQNAAVFNGDHFASNALRKVGDVEEVGIDVFLRCSERISKIIGNFNDIVSFPVLLNYQRLMSLKMADLVCGERPTITGANADENASVKAARDRADFDTKLYSTVLDISRFGDAIWRIYLDEQGERTFTCWTPTQWFPIVAQDGTNRITHHCLAWRENTTGDKNAPNWVLHVQIHGVDSPGQYISRVYQLDGTGDNIKAQLQDDETVATDLDICAVMSLKAYSVTNSIYGFDDYMNVDSIIAEIIARVGQISAILDKHADPNITGPVSMLSFNDDTGEYSLKPGRFFAVSPGEDQPKYMTWDGHLSSAFKQLEFLVNQLYILSEMGAAVLGGQDGSGTAISGTAMRFKMVNPLAKARRIANSITLPIRHLFASLCTEPAVPVANISVFWADGLPDDPRENIEMCKLASGVTRMMPLEVAIMEYFGRSNAEATRWIEMLRDEAEANSFLAGDDPNHPGPQDGTGVNPAKKGSVTGLTNFHGLQNE